MPEKISVIVVTFNRLDFLKQTIKSIINQTYSNLEILIIGDGDQPLVQEYIAELEDEKISYSFVEHCGYPAKARNLGIKLSTGSYIAFCDDDDIWLPDKLEEQLKILNDNKDIKLCFTNRMVIDSENNVIDEKGLGYLPSTFNLRNLLISNYVSYSSVLLVANILDKSGTFIDDIRFKAVEDYHLWIRIAYYGNVFFLPKTLVQYRVHGSNISGRLSVGAQKNIALFRDLFSKHKFKSVDMFIAYFIAYSKYIFYKIRGM